VVHFDVFCLPLHGTFDSHLVMLYTFLACKSDLFMLIFAMKTGYLFADKVFVRSNGLFNVLEARNISAGVKVYLLQLQM